MLYARKHAAFRSAAGRRRPAGMRRGIVKAAGRRSKAKLTVKQAADVCFGLHWYDGHGSRRCSVFFEKAQRTYGGFHVRGESQWEAQILGNSAAQYSGDHRVW